jgi:hypothetical protein
MKKDNTYSELIECVVAISFVALAYYVIVLL